MRVVSSAQIPEGQARKAGGEKQSEQGGFDEDEGA